MVEVAVDLEGGTAVGMILVEPARLYFPRGRATVFPRPRSPLLGDVAARNPELHLSLRHAEDVTVILQQGLQAAALVAQSPQHLGRHQLRRVADADLPAGVPRLAGSPLQRYPALGAPQQVHRDHVDDVQDQFLVQLRAIPRSFRRAARLEVRGPQVVVVPYHFGRGVVPGHRCRRLRSRIYDPLDASVERRALLLRVAPSPSDETRPLRRRNAQPVHLREEAAALAHAPHVGHVLRVLTLGGVAPPVFPAVELVGATGQQEEPALVGTARGDHGDPRGELVRVIAYDPIHAGEYGLGGRNNRADLVMMRGIVLGLLMKFMCKNIVISKEYLSERI